MVACGTCARSTVRAGKSVFVTAARCVPVQTVRSMGSLQVWDGLLVNLALLIAGVFLVSLTFTRVGGRDPWAALAVRYTLLVGTAFALLAHSVPLAPGLLFDFRSVPVALAARRHGLLAGLLVAVPIGGYRWLLGGPGAIPALTSLLLVAVFAAPRRQLLNFEAPIGTDLYRKPWVPV